MAIIFKYRQYLFSIILLFFADKPSVFVGQRWGFSMCVFSKSGLFCVAGSVEVSRRSPVASWLCAMLYCFGSYILADIMLGSSPLDYFQHNSHILLASAVW